MLIHYPKEFRGEITLSLCRFKKFKSFTIKFPSSGLLLLDGVSGSGKTTILEALSFVLYDRAKNSCYPRNSKNTKPTWVRLEMESNLTIFRQRRPNLLEVKNGDVNLKDAAAQSYIDRQFAKSEAWFAGGYLKQFGFCAFLNMSSSAKLRFLQDMTIPDKFEQLFKLTEEKLSAEKEIAEKLAIDIQIKEGMYKSLYKNFSKKVKGHKLWTLEEIQEKFSESFSDLSQLKETINTRYDNLILQLIGEIAKEKESITRQEEGFRQRKYLESREKELRKKLELIPFSTKTSVQIHEELARVSEKILLAKQSHRRMQLNAAKKEIERRLSLIPLSSCKYTLEDLHDIESLLKGPSIQELESEISHIAHTIKYLQYQEKRGCEEEIKLIRQKLSECPTRSDVESIDQKIWLHTLHNKKLDCPSCGISLFLKDDKLTEIPSFVCTEDLEELRQTKEKFYKQEKEKPFQEKKLKSLERKYNTLVNIEEVHVPSSLPHSTDVCELKIHKKKRLQLKEKLQNLPSINIQEEKKAYEFDIERSRLIRDKEYIDKELCNLPLEDVSEETASLIKTKEELLIKAQDIEKHEKQALALKSNIRELKEQMKHLPHNNPSKEKLEKLEKTCEKNKEAQKQFNEDIFIQEKLSDMKRLADKYNKMCEEETAILERVTAFAQIRKALILAEYALLDTFLNEFNNILGKILNCLFKEPINVIVRSLRKMKANDRIKPEINFEVYHKDNQFSNLNSLSGGEKMRISLALILTFNRICHTPFMLLDESFSNFDAHVKEQSISTIRKWCRDKLVIIINHDATEGAYDHVLRLE